MSFFGKKELEDLNNEASVAYEDYKSKAIEISTETQKSLAKLNALINTINAERHSLREEIFSLYDFLSKFTDVVEKLTVFDFNVEPLYVRDQQFLRDRMSASYDATFDIPTAPAVKVAKWVFLLQYMFVDAIDKRDKNKKKLANGVIELSKKKAEWDKDIHDRQSCRDFCEQAVDIANIYRVCIAMVKDAIKKQILPELQAVYCFFFTDVIRENILYDEEIGNVHLNPIVTYKDTRYHKHYLFVKNTCDFYVIICKFFTNTFLMDMLNDRTVSENLKERFNIDVAEVHRQFEMARNNIVFMEGN